MNARQLKAKLNDIDSGKVPIVTEFNKNHYLNNNEWEVTNMASTNGTFLYKKPLQYDDPNKSKILNSMVATLEDAIVYEMKKELYKKYLEDKGKSTMDWYNVKFVPLDTIIEDTHKDQPIVNKKETKQKKVVNTKNNKMLM